MWNPHPPAGELPQYQRALLAVSADPWTPGHTALAEEAWKHADRLIVAVGTDDSRRYVLPQKLRASLARQALGRSGVRASGLEVVTIPDGYTIADVVLQQRCEVVFRGARGPADLEIEERRRQVSGDLVPGLQERWFIWTPEDPRLLGISATRVRDAIFNGVFLPPSACGFRAQAALRYYLRGEQVVAVVGADGGEALARSIATWFQRRQAPCAVQVLPLHELGPAEPPSWGWGDAEQALSFRVRLELGKARPSLRLLCADSSYGLDTLLRISHGTLACEHGPGVDTPLRQAVRERGGRLVPLHYGEDGSLRGAEALLADFGGE